MPRDFMKAVDEMVVEVIGVISRQQDGIKPGTAVVGGVGRRGGIDELSRTMEGEGDN